MLEQLKGELREAIPERDGVVGWAKLEELPYLVTFLPLEFLAYEQLADRITSQRAVVKESLRVAPGAPGQLPRVVPEGGAVFCGQEIPAGVSII